MTTGDVNAPRVPTLRLNTGSGLASLNKEMEKMMECPVCQEIPLPPIYTCQTGHVICNECKMKLKQCALCKTLYTNSRNFPLESMVLAAKFYCSYRTNGCPVVRTVEELNKHHTICNLRPVNCHLTGIDDCRDAVIYLSDYLNHIKNVHDQRTLKPVKSGGNVFKEAFESTETSSTNWTTSLFNFDRNVFVNRVFRKGPIFYFGFYLIGDEAEAAKYAIRTTIQNANDCQVAKSELITEVLSIRALAENSKVRPNFALHRDLMEKLGRVVPSTVDFGSKSSLRWNVEYEIIPLANTIRKSVNSNFCYILFSVFITTAVIIFAMIFANTIV